MTATLQQGRQKRLEALVERVYGPADYPPDLIDTAGEPRYRVSRGDEAGAQARVLEAVRAGKRVLWVVNQVSRAQARAKALACEMPDGVPLVCYHSRFKLDDRVERHRETVEAIRAGRPAAVAVTTQVCEMSLDIDADLLVTEECPVTSLIQRMGRCRRGRGELGKKGPGAVLIYKPAEEKAYSKDDLAGLEAFLAYATGKEAVSQSDLEEGLARVPQRTEAPKLNSFVASGAYALAGEDSFRDIEAFNVPCVLRGEVRQYLDARPAEKPGFVVPVPKKLRPETDGRIPRYLFVAEDCHYDPRTGFWDEPQR